MIEASERSGLLNLHNSFTRSANSKDLTQQERLEYFSAMTRIWTQKIHFKENVDGKKERVSTDSFSNASEDNARCRTM